MLECDGGVLLSTFEGAASIEVRDLLDLTEQLGFTIAKVGVQRALDAPRCLAKYCFHHETNFHAWPKCFEDEDDDWGLAAEAAALLLLQDQGIPVELLQLVMRMSPRLPQTRCTALRTWQVHQYGKPDNL